MSASVLADALPQVANCPICKSLLEFGVGQFGVTLERCSNRRCVNRTPHRPQPEALGNRRRAMNGEGPRGRKARAKARGER